MNKKINNEKAIIKARSLIYEMIDASWELAEKKGLHPLENGCNCISCIKERKRLLNKSEKKWKYVL